MLITHKKLQPVQCYHIFSNSMVVYLAKNHYGSYSPQMVPTNPPGSWPIIGGEHSTWTQVISGVPQGTVLGPLLFLAYINDFPNNIHSSIRLFADDCEK